VPIQGTYSLFVLVLVVGSLASWQFSSSLRGYHAGAYVIAGLFSSALFIWTVFAHEAAHVAAARRYRAHVNGVTLSLLGGETAISGQPGSPWQGIVVATVGPAVSMLCGIGCLGAAFGVFALHAPPLLAVSLAWVGVLCISLAIINLLPAAPLDGGHVLQSLVWAATGSRTRASAIAGRAGQVLGIAMVGGAVWLAAAGVSWYSVAATAVVGVPLWRGASAVRRAAVQRARLAGVRVSDLLRSGEAALHDDDTVQVAERRLGARQSGYAGVVDGNGRAVAILPVARVREWAVERATHTVARMTKRRSAVPTAAVDEPVADVLERTNAQPKPVAVIRDGKLVGVLDPDDIRAAMREPDTGSTSDSQPSADDWPGRAASRAAMARESDGGSPYR